MIDVYELLRTKENDLIRVRQEIEALRLVAPLLSDSEGRLAQTGFDSPETRLPLQVNAAHEDPSENEQSRHGDPLADAIPPKRTLRDWFSRAAGE